MVFKHSTPRAGFVRRGHRSPFSAAIQLRLKLSLKLHVLKWGNKYLVGQSYLVDVRRSY
jgi:hypothetical protein